MKGPVWPDYVLFGSVKLAHGAEHECPVFGFRAEGGAPRMYCLLARRGTQAKPGFQPHGRPAAPLGLTPARPQGGRKQKENCWHHNSETTTSDPSRTA